MLQAERMPDLVDVMRMGKDHRLKQRQLPLQVDENLTVSSGFPPATAAAFARTLGRDTTDKISLFHVHTRAVRQLCLITSHVVHTFSPLIHTVDDSSSCLAPLRYTLARRGTCSHM